MKYNFHGYATKANIRCSDGRTILPNAFKDCDGKIVPLVWQHQRENPENVIGHALLENRDDGVYAYCALNDTPKAQTCKALVEHGDITAMSIFANKLIEKAKQVSHGIIREVSIVIAPANPGALIQNTVIEHDDGETDILLDEAEMYFDAGVTAENGEIAHADDKSDPTAKEIFDTLNEDQKKLFYAAVAHALNESTDEEEMSQSDDEEDEESEDDELNQSDEEGGNSMKKNVFESQETETTATLSHSDMVDVLAKAKRIGSLKEALEEKALEHGITDIDILFPEAKSITPTPEMIMRQQEWVAKVWNATRKSPFSRIKSAAADITGDEARARGYIKGKKKVEEQFGLLKRTTTPQTVYKKQALDRDDIIDITDFDVVAWLKAEMRLMLNEELARAVLVGDGRQVGSDDKISEDHIRSIYHDEEVYAIHKLAKITADDMTYAEQTDAIIEAVYQAREDYRGSGTPTFYCPSHVVTAMLLAKDAIGHRLYNTVNELASALRVREIVEVPVMDNQVRETGSDGSSLPDGYETSTKYDLLGIMVNLSDYTVGADRGGSVTMFDDFDIDYNKEKYLIETRCSGALYRPKSAIVLEKKHTAD